MYYEVQGYVRPNYQNFINQYGYSLSRDLIVHGNDNNNNNSSSGGSNSNTNTTTNIEYLIRLNLHPDISIAVGALEESDVAQENK